VRNRDPRGYYAALNVVPGANQQEIRLAYEFLKVAHKKKPKGVDMDKVQTAYDVDEGRPSGFSLLKRLDGTSRLNSVPLLLVLVSVFFGVFGVLFGPLLMAPFIRFDVGDDLYWKTTRAPVGVVLEYVEDHEFPDGAQQAAYRIQPTSGEEQLLPALDLNRHCSAR
jgi:hypothetical protein